MENQAAALEVLLGVEGMDESLCSVWIGKLAATDKDPLIYAKAFAYRAKRLDTPSTFFAWMLRESKVEEVLGKSVGFQRSKESKRTSRRWPFPRGRNACRTCGQGAGWYPVAEGQETDAHIEAIEKHEAQNLSTLKGIDTTIFLCLECNPSGAMSPEFEKATFPAYPVGAQPPPSFKVETIQVAENSS